MLKGAGIYLRPRAKQRRHSPADTGPYSLINWRCMLCKACSLHPALGFRPPTGREQYIQQHSPAQWELYSRGESMPRGSQEVLHMSSVHPTSLSMLASVSRYSACGGRGRVVTGVWGSERHRL